MAIEKLLKDFEGKTYKLLKVVDDRNRIYHQEVSEEIFSHIGGYINLYKKVLKTLKGV